MSEVLARLRVKEEHGIRRFLYPLSAEVILPVELNTNTLGLLSSTGNAIPLQITSPFYHEQAGYTSDRSRLDFALSLGPMEEIELFLTSVEEPVKIPDPLRIEQTGEFAALNSQQHFQIALGWDGSIQAVHYDGMAHLRGRSSIRRNGDWDEESEGRADITDAEIGWSIKADGNYGGQECEWETVSEITACKSWTTVNHKLYSPRLDDHITFVLPMAITSPTLTCDFGIGGGTFGKLQEGSAEEIVWRTKFEEDTAQWSLATAGRTDYVGQTSLQEFRSQRWFHLIDSDKALAVAITEVPESCQEIVVSMNTTGDVVITFRLGELVTEAVTFGVCYHFLNDIPAIAAATNPQSILLPPRVEVLPV